MLLQVLLAHPPVLAEGLLRHLDLQVGNHVISVHRVSQVVLHALPSFPRCVRAHNFVW